MGRDKATLPLAGMTLLERTLVEVPRAVPLVVVGPTIPVWRPADFCREDPVGGGPVAALAAGLERVRTPVVVVLATDLPFVGTLPALLAAAMCSENDEVDAVIPVDDEGEKQPLCAAYRVAALNRAVEAGGSASGTSMRSMVERLTDTAWKPAAEVLAEVALRDVDTPADLAVAREVLERGGSGTTTPPVA